MRAFLKREDIFSNDPLSFADLTDRRSVKSPSKILLSVAGFLERHVKYIP